MTHHPRFFSLRMARLRAACWRGLGGLWGAAASCAYVVILAFLSALAALFATGIGAIAPSEPPGPAFALGFMLASCAFLFWLRQAVPRRARAMQSASLANARASLAQARSLAERAELAQIAAPAADLPRRSTRL